MDLEKSKKDAMEEMGIGGDLFVELLAGFTVEAAEGVETMDAALGGDDFDAVRAEAHKMRGAAGGLRIIEIQDAAERLEVASGRPSDPDSIRRDAEALKAAVEEMKRLAGAG